MQEFSSRRTLISCERVDRLKFDGQTAEQRDVLASRIIANFMAGITDDEELISLSRRPLSR
ncbi:hypothetical protein RFM98_00350 [Mesorhizobium sp. VK9D]|uniref:hypothetical protein n=1 Tax=Mesorhizobium australafricanum TaxID=3072311 RepID=UPI002A2423CF|nr:hypothetical protein [Mesorhizobium sp. VK9D]MDX8451197.1 hypothetical protein [Mesorhizobium sp. VK9D]